MPLDLVSPVALMGASLLPTSCPQPLCDMTKVNLGAGGNPGRGLVSPARGSQPMWLCGSVLNSSYLVGCLVTQACVRGFVSCAESCIL